MKKMNRETWLNRMARELNRLVFKPAGIALNLRKVKISVGYPPKGGASKNGKTIGVCFKRICSDADVNEIFINPCLDKSQVTRVAGVLVHELIHAVEDCQGHGASFRKMAIACGLTGKMTATTETEELAETIKQIEKKIGAYPHKKLDYEQYRKPQTTRNLKIECPKCADTDPYFVRMSKTMYAKGAPSCGVCGTKMTDDIIGATIKSVQKASKTAVIESNFTLLEQTLLFEVNRLTTDLNGEWLTSIANDNCSWFTGEEMMDRLNWSKENVGGVMSSLVEKSAIHIENNTGGLVKKMAALQLDGFYNTQLKKWENGGGCKVFDLYAQLEKSFPEYCDNPYLA